MKITKTALEGVLILQPQIFGDERGYFTESYNKKAFNEAVGMDINFVQDNESKSARGVLRGFAFQNAPYTQSKLVRVIEGTVLDVVLDIRKGSPTFGKHITTELSAENKKQVFIPRGFAHAFITLSETATFQYKVDNYFNLESENGILFSDENLAINWQIPMNEIIVSDKDLSRPTLQNANLFKYGENLYDSK